MKVLVRVMIIGFTGLMSVFAEVRDFKGKAGNVIRAELVSHGGGKVTIKREDGQEFAVDPSIFDSKDEAYIRQWMSVNPEKNAAGDKGGYNLQVDAIKKVLERDKNSDSSHTRWVYEISIENRAQAAVTDLRIEYRIFFENYGEDRQVEGDEQLKQDLPFNRSLVITTVPVSISKNSNDRGGRSAGIKGCMVRITDKEGKVVEDWVSGDIGIKGKTWESTTRVDRCHEDPPPPVIR